MSEDRNYVGMNPAFEPNRKRVSLEVGAFVQQGDSVYKITQLLDFESAVGINVESGRSAALRLMDIRPVDAPMAKAVPSTVDISDIADTDWQIAEQRYAAIKPLLDDPWGGRAAVEARAKEVNVDTGTLYRWMQKFKAYEVISALIPQKRGWKAGNGRLSKEGEDVVAEVLHNFYLTKQRHTGNKTIEEVERRCLEKGIKPPSASAIRTRIARLSERERLRSRGYAEKARNKFMPVPGTFPNADYPLSVVQIDHTPVDLLLVDDVHRKEIGRPWLTLAIDVHSRMIVGYYLSFDPPSETSVAMCVAHSVLPKEDWMTLHGVDADWPVWGVPRTIHVDNGAEFRSNNFQKSCLMYGINLEFRPVKQPRYGGHIERLLGTFAREIHGLPGTTFSSTKEREGYESEKHAALTKSEFEKWLIQQICGIYHQRRHGALMLSPFRKWEIGIFGNAETPGVGIPPRPVDRHSILLDFLPAFKRTVQTFGVTIDGMSYYAEALRPWINANDPDTDKKRELIFRRDPRDISTLWFFDPDIKQYFQIPFADQALPAMSIWEYTRAKEKLKEVGESSIDKHKILRVVTEQRTLVEDAQEKTKRARRLAQRRRDHESKVVPSAPLDARPSLQSPTIPSGNAALVDLLDDVDPLGEIA